MAEEKIENEDLVEEFKLLRPDLEFIKKHFAKLRRPRNTTIYPELDPKRVDYELSLLNYVTQNKLIKTIENSIKSQDRLANVQIALTFVASVIALLQLVGMFLV